MTSLIDNLKKIKKSYLLIAGVLLLILLTVLLVWFNNSNSMQAQSTLHIEVYFEGEYRIADGPWTTYVEGEHIPATKGDVILRGNLYKRYKGENLGVYNSEDMPIAFYTNHINLTFCELDETGEMIYLVGDNENPLFGDSGCGKIWTAHQFMGDSENPIEILIHNPHRYGNETAIDEMLSGMALWLGIEFEKGVLGAGETERNVGLLFVMFSVMILGIALFSSLIHIKNAKIIWLLGSLILFAGIYFAYNADGVAFWSDSVVSNTTILGASMMLYMFFLAILAVFFMTATRRIGVLTVKYLKKYPKSSRKSACMV